MNEKENINEIYLTNYLNNFLKKILDNIKQN